MSRIAGSGLASRGNIWAEPAAPSQRRSAVGALECEIVTEEVRLLGLRQEWNALLERSPGHRFSQSFEWCLSGWQMVAKPRGRRLHCLVLRSEGRAVLIWPMAQSRRGFFSQILPLGPESSEYSEILVEDGPDADRRVAEAWRILRRSSRSDVIALPYVRAGSTLDRLVCAEPMLDRTMAQDAPFLVWTEYRDWAAYMGSLSKGLRNELSRKRRRLGEQGELVFEIVTAPIERGRVIDWLLATKRAWLAKTRLPNPWLGTSEFRDFLLAIASTSGPGGEVVIMTMTLDGAIVGAQLCSVDRTRLEGFLGAFDTAYAKFSPGLILLEFCLKWAFGRGIEVDFRIGAESYKRSWTNRACQVVSHQIANSPAGWVAVMTLMARDAADQLRQRISQRIPATWRRLIKSVLVDT